MSCAVWSKALMAGGGLVLALSAGACDRNESADIDRDTDRLATTDAGKSGHEGAPITLVGCLQRGSGMNNYILTQVNSPSDSPVATSGQGAAGGDAVQREQMREAKHAYVLDGEGDQLRDLVGKQVRVTGTVEENSELRRETNKRNDADRREGLDIDAGDLAKVDVQGVVQIADVCGDQR
jgi:hypothetical protein